MGLPPELENEHEETRRSMEKLNLRSSGAWAMSLHMQQAGDGINMFMSGLKTIMCVMYDLSRTTDNVAKLDAIRKFSYLQLAVIRRHIDLLMADIEDPTSGFHAKSRKEFIMVLHKMHRLKEEGVEAAEALESVIDSTVTDSELRDQLLRITKEPFSDVLDSLNNLLNQDKKNDEKTNEDGEGGDIPGSA